MIERIVVLKCGGYHEKLTDDNITIHCNECPYFRGIRDREGHVVLVCYNSNNIGGDAYD